MSSSPGGNPAAHHGESMTATVRTFTVPADAAVYVVRADVRDDYAVGPAVLVRVDSRRAACGYVHTYAPVSLVDGAFVVDAASAFEDSWEEVVAA